MKLSLEMSSDLEIGFDLFFIRYIRAIVLELLMSVLIVCSRVKHLLEMSVAGRYLPNSGAEIGVVSLLN